MKTLKEATSELGTPSSRYVTVALPILGAGALLAAFAIGVAASSSPPPSSGTQTSAAVVAAAPITLPSPCWRIGVITDGIHRLSYGSLDTSGVPVAGADPDDIHVLWRGQEVALHEVGDGDSAFESGESFLFYAVKFHGSVQEEKYTEENVYWLYVDDSAAGLRMDERSVAPGGGTELTWYTATIRVEENENYWARWTDTPGSDATWFWDRLDARNTTLTFTYPITLSAPALGTYSGTLAVEMAGYSNNAHDLRFSVNGTVVGTASWTGDVGYTVTLPVAGGLFTEGANDIGITIVAETSRQAIYLNWIEVEYRRRPAAQEDTLAMTVPLPGTVAMTLTDFASSAVYMYDITHPQTPTRLVDYATALSGTSYAVALSDDATAGMTYVATADTAAMDVALPAAHYPDNDLVSSTEGADEVIVVPTEFMPAVQPLANRRRSQGLRVRVVDVNDVYALFNGGVVHPEAIRSFVAHAYANWSGDTLRYLLLFGDGDINPKGYNPAKYGEHVPTLIPPYLEFADPLQGEAAVDARYGDVDWDGMPEVMVGRIPAATVQQSEDAVAKILAYEDAPASAWTSRILMVTDNGSNEPEGFEELAERLVTGSVPGAIDVQYIHLRDYCGPATTTNVATLCPSATLALTQTWSQGAAMLTYVGHAAVYRWGHEELLRNTQMAGLNNTTGLPFLISLDCWDGNWMWPVNYPVQTATDARSMGEWATTVLTDRGAIATFGPSSLAYPSTEEVMAHAMYEALFEDHVYRLGDLTQAGREAIPGSYMARTYTLLGDPAMALRVMLPHAYLPMVQQGQ